MMPTLAVITTPYWNDLVALGALIVVVFASCHLARRLIDLAIEAMQRASRRLMRRRPELLDGYADFNHDPADGDMTAVMDGLREKRTEPVWSGKAQFDEPADPHSVPNVVVLSAHPVAAPERPERVDLTSVLPASGHLDEKPAETARHKPHSHARVEPDDTPTSFMAPVVDEPPVVDGEAPMEAVAAVSGRDGAA